ncbi:MAG: DEAD/DEAH box helicase, partial [Phycisphaerales bacterium]
FFSQMRKKNNSRAAGIEIGKFNNANTARRKMLSSAEGKMNLIYELTPIIRYSQAAIVYCGDIDSAENINDAISSEPDVTCSAYHSNIPAGDQRDILEAFRTKQIQCLVAVDMLDEGVDIPHADLAIILSSNQQKRQLIQRLGRILRKKENQRGAVLAMCYAKGTSEDPYNHSSHSAVDKVGQLELAREVIPLVPNSICVKRTVTQIQKQIRWG